MEVTKSNFDSVLPSVKEAIDQCDFLAIDTELTGLFSERSNHHAFDSMDERYRKSRELCSKFLIIQFGLSTFKYHPKQKKYTHKDFNFYIFPRPHIRQSPDHRFLCQTSSILFLVSHGFDFNKTFYEGIPYLRHDQEEKLRTYVASKYKVQRNSIVSPKKESSKANGQKEIDIPEEHKEFISEINERVDSFIASDAQTVITLEPCSGYRRKLIYDTVQQKHPTGIDMCSNVNEDNERFITIAKSSDEEKLGKLDMKETTDMDDIESAIGFRKVMEHISQSKKLVIGHHIYLDILHTIDKFFHTLPEDLQEFKEMLHVVFPQLIDTKYLASSDKLKPLLESTTLSNIVKDIQSKSFELPKIEPEDGFRGYDLSDDRCHEAGYDAFLAGLVFIGLTTKLGSFSQSKNIDHVDAKSKILAPYINRVFVLRHYDIPSMNICGPDPDPNRDNVFYVSFPQEWKTVDLVELFLPYGDIYVNWLDDVSALVALKNPENSVSAKAGLLNKTSKMYHVRSYADYQKWVNQQSTKNVELKKPAPPVAGVSTVTKRKSRSEDRDSHSMELIPECDENEAEIADDTGKTPSKKLKKSYDDPESGEVTSTFEEGNSW